LKAVREFQQAVGLTGTIVTKLDGSGKGGVVIAIQNELNIPTRFIGTGEKIEQLSAFDGRDFIAQMVN
jgi:fused signal recognition particle receptor